MNREQWLKERQKGIGGSDVACILGMSPYKTNVRLWEEKIGLVEPEDISEKEYVKNGIDSEDAIRKLFAVDYRYFKVEHEENEIIRSEDYNFIFVSPDSKITDLLTDRKGFLEIKRCEIQNANQYAKWQEDSIPQNYYLQCLQYFLANKNFTFGYLRAYLIRHVGNKVIREIKDYTLLRGEVEEDIEYLKNCEIDFWKYVETKQKPPLILPSI